MSRHSLAIRCKTTESQKEQEKPIDKLIGYFISDSPATGKNRLPQHAKISLMDETAVWQDMVSDTTVTTLVKARFDCPGPVFVHETDAGLEFI